MKKFRFLIMAMLIATVSAVFVSCDEDVSIAYTLEGTWEGNMYISSVYDGRTYQSTYTQLDFMRDPYSYSSGRGVWVDYYSKAPWDYVANHIDWTVRDRVIYIHFEEDSRISGKSIDMEIYDYSLSDNHFRGYLRDGDNVVEFNMVHTSSPNWSSYRYGYYDPFFDDYYSKSFPGMDDEEAVVTEKPVRKINKTE